jgi:dolichol-phosphate mannosyltransferase
VPDRRLTIVVPAFNAAAHVEATLTVVVEAAQRILDDYEVIVVDDGSTDGTGAIAEGFAAAHRKILVQRQPMNRGVGAAYWHGLNLARFPYLTLVPGDNVFTRTAVENVFGAVGLAPLVVSYRDNMHVRAPLRRTLSVVCTFLMRLITGRNIRDAHSMYVFPVELARTIPVHAGYGYHIETLGRLLCLVSTYTQVPSSINPRPDMNSGVMRFRVVAILAATMIELAGWRVTRALRQFFVASADASQRASQTGDAP